MVWDNTKSLITNLDGHPVPQVWDESNQSYKADEGDRRQYGKTAGGLFVPIRVDDVGRQEVIHAGNIQSVSKGKTSAGLYEEILVDGDGKQVVEKQSSFDLITLLDAASVAPGTYKGAPVLNANGSELYFLVAIDKAPYGLTASLGPWAHSGSVTAGALYPRTLNYAETSSITFPRQVMHVYNGDYSSFEEAFANRQIIDSKKFAPNVYVYNYSAEIATVTLKALVVRK